MSLAKILLLGLCTCAPKNYDRLFCYWWRMGQKPITLLMLFDRILAIVFLCLEQCYSIFQFCHVLFLMQRVTPKKFQSNSKSYSKALDKWQPRAGKHTKKKKKTLQNCMIEEQFPSLLFSTPLCFIWNLYLHLQ